MTVQLPITNALQRAKLSARDFWLLADSGAFEGFARTELIEGEIWAVNALHRWHARMVHQLSVELELGLRRIASPLVVYSGVSAALSEDSVPEPDLAIGLPGVDGPLPVSDLKLAIEVADSTRDFDLGDKAALYARNGVAEYWVASRDDGCIFQHWQPTSDGFTRRERVAWGEVIEAQTIHGLRITAPSD